jgi:hypothetical protein
MYALGRELEYYDMPQVRAIEHSAERADYRFAAIVAGVVRSDAFRMQAAGRDADGGSVGAVAAQRER